MLTCTIVVSYVNAIADGGSLNSGVSKQRKRLSVAGGGSNVDGVTAGMARMNSGEVSSAPRTRQSS